MTRRIVAVAVAVAVLAAAPTTAVGETSPSASSSSALEDVVDLSALVQLPPPRVADWSPLHVARWVNMTLGYPEYAEVPLKHLMDGPTLLVVDLTEAFGPFSHPIHLAKFRAHRAILRDECLCPAISSSLGISISTWSFYDAHGLFYLTPAVAIAPRAALLYVWQFKAPLFDTLMGVAPPPLRREEELELLAATGVTEPAGPEGPDTPSGDVEPASPSLLASLVYLTLSLLVPNAVVVYYVGSVWSLHWAILTPALIVLIYSQVVDMFRISGRKVSAFISYSMIIPVVAFALSFILPLFLQRLALWVYVLHTILGSVSILFKLFFYSQS